MKRSMQNRELGHRLSKYDWCSIAMEGRGHARLSIMARDSGYRQTDDRAYPIRRRRETKHWWRHLWRTRSTFSTMVVDAENVVARAAGSQRRTWSLE
jgi:hypothetical protein